MLQGEAGGTGNGTVAFRAGANPGAARNGSLTIAGVAFPVTQNASGGTANTTSGAAANLLVGQRPVNAGYHAGAATRWYRYAVRAGRSYCAEATSSPVADRPQDSVLNVFRADGTSALGTSDDAPDEPGAALQSRVCYMPAVSEDNLLQAAPFGGAPASVHTYGIRVLETTLFSNWFFVGGDYSAYTLLRNTTDTPVSYTVTWRSASGAAVATTGLQSLGGHGDAFFDARAFPGALAAASGSVEVAHTGSPDALAASTTVMSPTTGLSFDAPFLRRQPW
jgi:hypothetical protein